MYGNSEERVKTNSETQNHGCFSGKKAHGIHLPQVKLKL